MIAIGLYIAFYYGLTGFACGWYYRRNLTSSARNLWMQGILPVTGGLMLFFLRRLERCGWTTTWPPRTTTPCGRCPFIHWQIGGAFVIAVVSALVGVVAYIYCRIANPSFFKEETLTRGTPTLVPDGNPHGPAARAGRGRSGWDGAAGGPSRRGRRGGAGRSPAQARRGGPGAGGRPAGRSRPGCRRERLGLTGDRHHSR